MKIKKILSVLLTLCLFVNVSFAFDPYADEEIEKKSYKKLYYGIALTLLGGFLTYDGFSLEKVDVSRPSVDYTTILHSEWSQNEQSTHQYTLRSGYSPYPYSPEGSQIDIEQNVLYNNGNVDLRCITIEIRYNDRSGYITDKYPEEHKNNGIPTSDGYHRPSSVDCQFSDPEMAASFDIEYLGRGQSITWHDIWEYRTDSDENAPVGSQRAVDPAAPDPEGLLLGKDALTLMDIRVKLNKNQQYTPIYQTKHKSDAEGVAGILIGITGIYFIIDHFLDMHKFNAYAKRHHLNLRVATASNEYKLMLQKRI